MSIPKPESLPALSPVAGAASAAPVAQGADSALIASIANALYRDARAAPAAATVAAAEPAVPQSPLRPSESLSSQSLRVPPLPLSQFAPAASVGGARTPVADTAADGNTVALAGGFPTTTSASGVPPVHPSVVDAEPESTDTANETDTVSATDSASSSAASAFEPTRAGESVPSGTHRLRERDGHEFGEPYFYPATASQKRAEGSVDRAATVQPVPSAGSLSPFAAAGAAPVVPASYAAPAASAGSAAPAVTAASSALAEPAESGSAQAADYYFLQQGRAASAPVSPLALAPASPPAAGGAGLRADPLWANSLGQNPAAGFDIQAVRRDFPALHQLVNGKPLVWLDNAATTHKSQAVIDATSAFYARHNSNIHRAAHTLAARSTDLFEAGREKVRRFLGAGDAREIVFVRGTTEAINLVAQSFGRSRIGEGDEILLTELEHHANIVPWQILASQVGAVLRVIPINDRGELIVEKIPELITSRTKIVSVAHVSNSLGTVNPVQEIIALAHSRGVPVLVDGAQSTPHLPVNVQALDADFYVFSGHKIFGPTGIGALYAKRHWLETLPAWQGGGHMIKDVTFEKTVFNGAPEKFEAGTPDIAGVVGLGAAIDYLFSVGIPAISAYEHSLLEYATQALATVPGLRPIGTAANKASVLSFVIPGYDNVRIARYLDGEGIAVRAGHHCAQPAIRHFGLESSVRPSLAFYNTFAEVDALADALRRLRRH